MCESTIQEGHVYQTPDGPVRIVSKVAPDKFRVTDPTAFHPQDGRSGYWDVPAEDFREDVATGTIERATLEVNAL